jgi:hypothetical protein
MVTPVIHRKWAREFLARADRASTPRQKLGMLRLAVNNTVRAINLEATDSSKEADSEPSEQGPFANRRFRT